MRKIIKMIYFVFSDLKKYIENLKFKLEWREVNKNNRTIPTKKFPIDKVRVGRFSYGEIEVQTYGNKDSRLEIGNFVSIAPGVVFLLDGNHEINTFTTYPFRVMCLNEKTEALTKGPIIVEDDVWLGTDSVILSGITIGQGAIIAARSVVTKNVPPYAVVAGNPAKIIKYRYSKEIIDEILEFDWSRVDLKKIEKLKNKLYESLTLDLVKTIKKEFGEN